MLTHIRLKSPCKFLYFFRRQGQACSLMVSTKLGKDITFGSNGFIQVECRNTAATALRHTIVNANQNCWQVILIYQTGSNNTNYALVPTFGGKHDGSIDMFLFGKHRLCFSHNITANVLAHSIFPVQFCSDCFRFCFIFGNQKFNGRLSVFQTTNCIKARC